MIESPDILDRLRSLIDKGGTFLAMFDRAFIPRARALELIEMLRESLPEEMSQARELIETQEKIIEEAERKAGGIVDEAVIRAEKLVDADIITREAKQRADEIRDETDRYVREKLSALEIELEDLLKEVRGGIRATGGTVTGSSAEPRNAKKSLDMES